MEQPYEQLKEPYNSVLLCCSCRQLLTEPMRLSCLHHCCRTCLRNCTSRKHEKCVECPICFDVTEISSCIPNTFLARCIRQMNDEQVERSTNSICGVCDLRGELAETVYCNSCKRRFCGACATLHKDKCEDNIQCALKNSKAPKQAEKPQSRK